jgi:hypothetical protein
LQSIAPSQGDAIQFGTGSVGLPSISFIGDSNTGIYSPAADTIAFVEGGVEAMRIDSSANVGIGTSSPSEKLTIANGGLRIAGALASSAPNNASLDYSGGLRLLSYGADASTQGILTFWTVSSNASAANERMRIDSSGNLLVNTTTKYGKITSENLTAFDPTVSSNLTNVAISTRGSYGGGVSVIDGTQGYTLWAQASGADFYIRRATTTGSYTGGVYISNAAGSWSSASDERLKNIIRPIENATEKLSGLRCVIGEYKDNVGNHHPFLIAQDVQAVFPEVVNQADEQGHLGMSYTDMVPILVKAIQEQQAMIDTMKQEIAELKVKVGE